MRLLAVTALALLATASMADGTYHTVRIPGWKIETSEYFEHGTRLKKDYPVYNLIDGKSATAWVYNDLDYPKPRNIDGLAKPGRYYIAFSSDEPTVIDELKIQIGYQKSKELFNKNSRPSQLKIYSGFPGFDKPIRTIDLKDGMGWKSIRIPRQKYERLTVEFSKVTKGSIDDLCVSEMMPRAGGVDLIKRTPAFLYTHGGSCCGAEYLLQSFEGKTFAVAGGEFPCFEFSPDGKHVAGIDAGSAAKAWVAKLDTGKIVWSRKLRSGDYGDNIVWTGNRSLTIKCVGSESSRSYKARF